MGSPAIFKARRTKLLTPAGLELSSNGKVDHDGWPNYIPNGHFEVSIAGVVGYADTPGVAPVDGTGGTPTMTFTRSTTAPLDGIAHLLITKPASVTQGNGCSIDFTIPSAQQARVQQIDFDYEVKSGTYASDIHIYVYDITNALLIQPSAFIVEPVIGPSSARLTFQTSSNSTSYRLIFHQAGNASNDYTLAIDNIRLGPQVVPLGAPVTDWVSYTPTFTPNTNASITAYWRRVGDSLQVSGSILWSGAGSATVPTINLPPGLSIDTSKLVTASNHAIGVGSFLDSGIIVYNLNLVVQSTTQFALQREFVSSSLVAQDGTLPVTPSTNDRANFLITSLPIAGWSSSTVVSSSADTRVVAAIAQGTNAASYAGGVPTVVYNTLVNDTHAAYNPATGVYTCPVPGFYRVTASLITPGVAWSLGDVFQLLLFRNGVQTRNVGRTRAQAATTLNLEATGSATIFCNAGDTLDVRVNAGKAFTLQTATDNNYIMIERLSGPSQIQASSVVAMSARLTSGGSVTANNPIVFNTADVDTHGGLNTATGRYTIPDPGNYRISFTGLVSGVTTDAVLWVNGVSTQALTTIAASSARQDSGSVIRRFNAGDIIDIRPNSTTTFGTSTPFFSNFSVERIGGIV